LGMKVFKIEDLRFQIRSGVSSLSWLE